MVVGKGLVEIRKSRQRRLTAQAVEIPGFEPGQTEPKSVVLPLHHISIPNCKDITIFVSLQDFNAITSVSCKVVF